MTVRITTNNVPRLLIDSYQLTAKEREEFDYIDWQGVEEGRESATFFRYRGRLYDLGEFQYTGSDHRPAGNGDTFAGWDGYQSDSFFSGIVVRYVKDDTDYVVVGTYYASED